jgi:hypothetical protein
MAFTPSKDQLPQSLTTYLTKWLEVATKGNVVLHSHMTGATQSMIIFKCNKCQQNWHIGDHLFYCAAAPGLEVIPSELQDWVKEHRHVCKKYVNDFPETLQANCKNCQWPYGAHEESWIAQQAYAQQNVAKSSWHYETLVNAMAGKATPKLATEPEKPKPIPPLPEPKGRKFR